MGARELELLRRWDILPDAKDRGLEARWWERPPETGWTACRTDRAWQHALGDAFDGVAWYRRCPRLPKRWLGGGRRVRLRFGAVATDCRVWVNGREVGGHSGDYVPFEFDITEAVGEEEKPEILCRVDQVKGVPPKVWGEEPWGGHITKGFHDVLGLQHGGVWGGVSVRVTGPVAFRPNGLAARADASTGRVRVTAEFLPHESEAELTIMLIEPGPGAERTARIGVRPGQTSVEVTIPCESPALWSPDSPSVGVVRAVVRSDGVSARDEAETAFAFRTVQVGGRDNRRILLNGRPLLIRGVLDWGVEPEHVAPAPTPEQVRERFVELRERGFNCVCLCMVYPPEHFYDIADQTGMLLWQIHPVWKSSMAEEHLPEYRRLFDEFFRRDRRHPSVFLVSATCEHERFDEDLGRWWWGRGREELPGNLLQVQTGFLQWSDTERMDLWDEHTYDNTGRWVGYFDDMERFFEGRPARPFVMGETIIGTHWPDTTALLERLGDDRPWWAPKGLDGFRDFEHATAERFGAEAVMRLREAGDRFSHALRKSQCEILRARPHNGGWVMNHLRDVAVCQCGFQDDLGRWRASPEQLRPFLADRALLLRSPGFAVGLSSGRGVEVEVGCSNFAPEDWRGEVGVRVEQAGAEGRPPERVALDVPAGEVGFAPLTIDLAPGEAPTRLTVRAEADGVEPNAWRLWRFPGPGMTPDGVYRLETGPFTEAERQPDFEERRYSSGWALECVSWKPRLPDVGALLPQTPAWTADGAWPKVGRLTIVTARLTEHLLAHLERGGRIVLLASKAAGSPPTRWANLYGQVPLVPERSPALPHALVPPGQSAWVLDTLGLDLNRWSARAVPVGPLGIEDAVEPVVRLVFTHDKGRPEAHDQVFLARVGDGLLAVSTLDHANPAGRYLLARLIEHVHSEDAPARCAASLPVETVRGWLAPSAG